MKLKIYLDNNKKLVSKWVVCFLGGEEGGRGGMKNKNKMKDENEGSYFMSKMHDNSAQKMILGVLPIPCQACIQK